MVTIALSLNQTVAIPHVNSNNKFDKSPYHDKFTYKKEYFEEDDDRNDELEQVKKNTIHNRNGRILPVDITPTCNKIKSTNQIYINLLESKNRIIEMRQLNHFQLAQILSKNQNNISKLDSGQKCILSYRYSVFASKQHKSLLVGLDKYIESYFDTNNINKDKLLGFYISTKLTPKDVFKKSHNPPPFDNIISISL